MKYSIVFLLVVLAQFAKGQTETTTQNPDSVGIIVIQQSPDITRISDYRKKTNSLKGGITGFRIQIYFGNSREEAQKAMDDFKSKHPDISCDMVFENPYVKVRVGEYRTRLDAQPLYYALKPDFESVIIIQVNNMAYPKLGTATVEE